MDVFQAISHPTRRLMLSLIAVQSMSQSALAENFNTTRQAISKHIKVLSDSNLIKQEQIGREVYYHLNPVKMTEIDDWLEPFRKLWQDRFESLDEILKDLDN